MKRKIITSALLIMVALLTACTSTTTKRNSLNKNITFKDDLGTKIVLKSPAKRIISLYSAHTENLFSLGLNKEIIGVGTSDTYPKEVTSKKVYDYKGDTEAIIGAKPDVVLMRNSVSKAYPDFVKSLKNAGIQVVSLYPQTFNDFDKYIGKLATMTGKEKEAKTKLEVFHKDLKELKAKSDKVKQKKNVFLETMAKDYKTCGKNSFAWESIELAGGKNIAEDAEGDKRSSSIAPFGQEKLLSKANQIEVYVAQKGTMNSNVSEDIIKRRPGFNTVKAVKDNKIVIVDEKLISSATFRFVTGVTELQKSMYPELYK